MELIELEECGSTNSHLASIASSCAHGTVVCARSQTAGRGQRGNSWESAPGANITMSLLLRPAGLHPARQFVISEAVSLAITGVLRRHLPGFEVRIKWPNDIYVGDEKICGILIENSITSTGINHTIVGAGINVNQENFVSDAPNPVSMRRLAGHEFPLRELTLEFAEEIVGEVDRAVEAELCDGGSAGLEKRYFDALWRTDGFYPYVDRLRDERIEARVESVAPDGVITMALRGGERRSYAFKEIRAVVKESLI